MDCCVESPPGLFAGADASLGLRPYHGATGAMNLAGDPHRESMGESMIY